MKNNPIFKGMELIEEGLKTGDWSLVSDGYWVITHQRIDPVDNIPKKKAAPAKKNPRKKVSSFKDDDVVLKPVGTRPDKELARLNAEKAKKTVKDFRPPVKKIEEEYDQNDENKAIRFYSGRRGGK